MSLEGKKVAIVCDWLIGTGGAEKVVLEIHKLFPDAPIFTAHYDSRAKKWFGNNPFAELEIKTLWTNYFPNFLRKFMGPLRAVAFKRLDLSEYDIVISSSGAEAKFVVVNETCVHICYCHAPTHYYWRRYDQYLENPGLGLLNPLARFGLKLLVGPMRKWDFKAAQRPNFLITNSRYSASEIKHFYGRESEVIHPPVEVEKFAKANQKPEDRRGLIISGRQTPYKKIDAAIQAAVVAELPLLVIGNGPQHQALKALAGRNVTFLRKTTDAKLAEHLGASRGYVFPGIEDFGIAAVEALAAGTPVLAYKKGGSLDFVTSKNGMLFDNYDPIKLAEIMKDFMLHKYNHAQISADSRQFSSVNFRNRTMQFIKQSVK